jgi:hypothetical protein
MLTASLPRQTHQQEAHRAVPGILKIVGFFGLIVVFACVLQGATNYGLKRIKTSKFGTINRVVRGEVNANIIISGSSRALCHYDPVVLQKIAGRSAYNLGMNASQTDVQLAMLKVYLKHNFKPQLIVQNLDLFSFEVTQKGQIYDPALFVPYLNEIDLYQTLRGIDPNVWKWKYIPLYGYTVEDMRFTWMVGLLGCIGINGKEDYVLGFNPRQASWNKDFENFRASAGDGVTYRIDSKGVETVRDLIKLCRSNDIPLIFVYSPEYIEMQGIEKNRGEILAKFRQICKDTIVPFWDYSESPICARRDYFNNSQHLNAKGAEEFSTDLAKRLRETDFASH